MVIRVINLDKKSFSGEISRNQIAVVEDCGRDRTCGQFFQEETAKERALLPYQEQKYYLIAFLCRINNYVSGSINFIKNMWFFAMFPNIIVRIEIIITIRIEL